MLFIWRLSLGYGYDRGWSADTARKADCTDTYVCVGAPCDGRRRIPALSQMSRSRVMGRGEAWAAASSSLVWGVNYLLFVIRCHAAGPVTLQLASGQGW